MTVSALPDSRFRPDIEGLRAIAVLAVVVYHTGAGAVGGGYVGVDVFFVISGFLITLRLFRELRQTGRISFSRFYGRRVVRLLPASTAVVLATLVVARYWLSPLAAKAVSIDALAAVAYSINIRLAVEDTNYLTSGHDPSPLQHLWSLAVEEQFYFVWPLLLFLASAAWLRHGRPSRRSAASALVLLAAGSFALCVTQTYHSQPWAYFGIQSRAWELALGALIAVGADRLAGLRPTIAAASTWLGLAAILASALEYTDNTPFPGYAALIPVLGAVLVVAGGCPRPARGAQLLLGTRPLQWIGRLSYSWYLWHWPVLTLARGMAGHVVNVWMNVALAAAALVPAWLSLQLVENRIRFHRGFQRRPRRGLVLGAALSVATVSVVVTAMRFPARVRGSGQAENPASVVTAASGHAEALGNLATLIRTSTGLTAVPANLMPTLATAAASTPQHKGCLASLDATSAVDTIGRDCNQLGDRGSATTLVLFGDSHAEQWLDAVAAVALQRHWRLAVLTKADCTPADTLNIRVNTHRAFTECARWRDDAFRVMATLKPAIVLIAGRNYSNAPVDRTSQPIKGQAATVWATALLHSAIRVRRLGARPVILQDTPDPTGLDVPECIAAHPSAVQQCTLPVRKAIPSSRRAAIAAAAVSAGISVIDPRRWFCTDKACPAIIGNTLVYRDASHVTTLYVRLLTPLLDAELPQPAGTSTTR